MSSSYFTPKQVTDPNDILDEKSNLCIRFLFVGTQAIAHKVECHDKSSNTDGYIELVDEKNRPVGELTIQAKTYKAKYEGQNKALIPAYFVSYANIFKNKVCLFFAVEPDANRIFWKYISDDYIREFQKEGDNECHIYHFSADEIVTRDNVRETIGRWKQLFNEKLTSFSQIKKNSEVIISENRIAFQIINTVFIHLKNSFIERKEIDQLYKWVKEDLREKESNTKLLMGNAGMGKSVVMKQVIQRLETDGIKCLAIKADRLEISPEQAFNEQLEILISTFSSLIHEKKAVLVVDQIDALSQYITKDRSKLDNVMALIRQFSSDDKLRNVRIIVSCRSFDLEFDPKLSELNYAPKIVLGPLSKVEVEMVLNQLHEGLYNKMEEKTIAILQTPQHLNIFCKVYAGNKKKHKQYSSITELYDELWRQTINLASVRIDKDAAAEVLYGLAQKIYNEETLSPQWNYDMGSFKEASYLVSQGLIEKTGDKASFFHQSMYDYVFARYYTKEGGSFIRDLLAEKKHQGLFVRSTINLVLDYERAKNVKQYKEDVKTILFSGQIRPHIQLMFLWAMANRVDILPFERKCVKDLYAQNTSLFYAFIRRTWSKEWFNVITPLLTKDTKSMKIGNFVYENVYGYLRNHVYTSTEGVFKLLDSIKDKETRNTIARNVLRANPDYTLDIVTKWYDVLCKTPYEKADFLERTLPSNPKFVLDNISELISFILNPNKEGNNNDGVAERVLEDVCNPLMKEHPDEFYPLLRDEILRAINTYRVLSWKEGIDYNSVFLFTINQHHHAHVLHEWFGEMLKKKVRNNETFIIKEIRNLLNQKEASCYEFAFKAMSENPILFSGEIVAILKDNKLVDELLSFSNATYCFLEMLREWFSIVDVETLALCQNLICGFKSDSDLQPDKKRSYTGSYYPHLGYHQRKLIWAIPENLRNSKVKRKKQELDRKFGDEWKNEKPDHDVTAAFVCGGLMSAEQYQTVSREGWLKSFHGIKDFAKGKFRHFDNRFHADAFKQCVSKCPGYFEDFVFQMFEKEQIPAIYKLSGLDGLAMAHYPISQLLPLLWKSMEMFDKLSKEGFGHRLFEFFDNITNTEGEFIDRIVKFLEDIILSEYKSKYDSGIEAQFDKSIINDTLNVGVNSTQGHAIHSLAKIGKLQNRINAVYDFFVGACDKISLEHQLTAMLYLQKECYDNDLYNNVMFKYANKPIADYLFLNADRMHWFWCNYPEQILPYFKMILPKRRAKPILVQIMFFGMQYEKSKEISREMFENLLSLNEEEVIKKIIPLAYKHLSDETYGKQSEAFLRRYAKDSRDEIRHSYFIWCDKMPESNIELFMELLTSWLNSSLESGFHSIAKYLERCCNKYPYESYQCIKLLMDNKSKITYYGEEELLKILMNCYRNFMDDEEKEKADEVMDVFDNMMLNSYSNRIDKVLKEFENN